MSPKKIAELWAATGLIALNAGVYMIYIPAGTILTGLMVFVIGVISFSAHRDEE